MIYGKIETIILPANPVLLRCAKLLDHILSREPTYGEVACYIASRMGQITTVPVHCEPILSVEVLSLDILDHHIMNLYLDTIYSFSLHGCNSTMELLAYDFGLVLLTPGEKHVARENTNLTIPRVRYNSQTTAFYPHRLDYRERGGIPRTSGF